MLSHLQAFALAFTGCAATNVDNILLVLATGSRERAGRHSTVFFAVLGLFVLLAIGLSLGMDVAAPALLSWVGLVPMGMGLYELRPGHGHRSDDTVKATSLVAVAMLLTANSLDTLAVQTVLFSDAASAYHLAMLTGSLAAAALLATAAFVLLSHPGSANRLLPLATRARPWILIAVGLMIFMDTGFDIQ